MLGGMDVSAVIRHITDLDDVVTVEHAGDSFFFSGRSEDRTSPFATVVTGDHGERVSELDRDGAYRLNIGLTKATYTALFGPPPRQRDGDGVLDTGFDPTVRDRLFPHPFYASQYWVCVIDPSDATFDEVRPLLAEAHEFATRKAERRSERREGAPGTAG